MFGNAKICVFLGDFDCGTEWWMWKTTEGINMWCNTLSRCQLIPQQPLPTHPPTCCNGQFWQGWSFTCLTGGNYIRHWWRTPPCRRWWPGGSPCLSRSVHRWSHSPLHLCESLGHCPHLQKGSSHRHRPIPELSLQQQQMGWVLEAAAPHPPPCGQESLWRHPVLSVWWESWMIVVLPPPGNPNQKAQQSFLVLPWRGQG